MWSVVKTLYRQLPQKSVQTNHRHYPPEDGHYSNNLLDVTDPKNIKILYKADPEMKTVTVEGQVINITDPTNPTVIFGDPEGVKTVQWRLWM
jgi:hypothetical protein